MITLQLAFATCKYRLFHCNPMLTPHLIQRTIGGAILCQHRDRSINPQAMTCQQYN